MQPWSQSEYAVRAECGPRGAREIVGADTVAVVCDVLSFSTSVSVAVSRGIAVRPFRWKDDRAAAEAAATDAVLAVGRREAGPGRVSLSPPSIAAATGVPRLVLPSPNGSTITTLLAGHAHTVVVGSLRNATAVATWLAGQERPVALVAAGERWRDDDSLRPAAEDLWGIGAVAARLAVARPDLHLSPEADLARTAYLSVAQRLQSALAESASGRELIEIGYRDDVAWAADEDADAVVPVLTDGWFTAQ